MTTIKQVAKEAGVSTTTASYALNNRPEVKPETREKVLQAARKLNYIPNKAAQSFRNGRTNTITVVTSEDIEQGNTFSTEFFGVLAGAKEKKYDVLVKMMQDEDSEFEIAQLLGNNASDGYLLLGNKLEPLANHIVESGKRGVLLSAHSKLPISQINIDGLRWIREITDLVFENGKKSPVYFTFQEDSEEVERRIAGFEKSLTGHGFVSAKNRIFYVDKEEDDLERQLQKALDKEIDAVVCWNDFLAMQVMNLLVEQGKVVPGDIAVTGFDDNTYFSDNHWQLTTVQQPFYDKGRQAVYQLVDEMEQGDCAAQKIFMDCKIVRRESL